MRPRKNRYSTREWRRFSHSLLEARGHRCEDCGKPISNGIRWACHSLSGDHKSREPGDYATLCTSCHGKRHGLSYGALRYVGELPRFCVFPHGENKHFIRYPRHGNPERTECGLLCKGGQVKQSCFVQQLRLCGNCHIVRSKKMHAIRKRNAGD